MLVTAVYGILSTTYIAVICWIDCTERGQINLPLLYWDFVVVVVDVVGGQ